MLVLPLTVLAALAPGIFSQQIVLDDTLPRPYPQPTENKWTVFNSTIKRVAVIGAGPAGLLAATELVAHNFTVRLFEKAPGPGGNWLYSEQIPVRESYPDEPLDKKPELPDTLPATRYYEEGEEGLTLDERWREHWQPRPIWNSLHTNSPSVITELTEVPYPPDHSWLIDAHTIGAHVRAYATINHLNANDESPVHAYSTRVEKIYKAPKSSVWQLTLRRLKYLEESKRIKATWWTEDFDAVVVGAGPYDTPHVPDIEGIVQWGKAKAQNPAGHCMYHSRVYRNPERYSGKTVLIVGVATSGSEIARDIGPFTKKLYASHRKIDWENLHPLQRRSFMRFPKETEFIPEISSFQPLPSLEYGIQKGQIVLINGTVLSGIDEIILATGYKRSYPFLLPVLEPEDKAELVKPPRDVFTGAKWKNIHWTGHYIPDPTLAFTTVRPWTVGRYQSYGFAKVWEGTARLPNEAELWRQYNSSRWNNFRGLFGTGPSEALLRQYVTWLNSESLEHGGRLVAPYPVEKREMFVYFANIGWAKDFISKENFTRFENLPASEWSKDELWDAFVLEDEFW
ncbi:hypothetical protein D9758_005614 [Tetrapyrgos nigripes]|uniref:FAD/NAD(P)-binding domain-containing protein n=1 Tax=Tetrapyrgos nigripes TaxID=182062 RepID=A0A8H5GGX1_9AGAR|nr:hypothetical protein D9758_005614 [Tetrapyrgos nigripes]